MKITKEQIKETLKLVMNEEADYKVFFKKALEKAGKSIPSMSDDEKKAFFNKIDAAWDAKSEVKEGNAFGAAVVAAKEAGEDEFEVDGEKFKVEESHSDCGCGCGGVTEGGCNTKSVNEATDIYQLKKIQITKFAGKGEQMIQINAPKYQTAGDHLVMTTKEFTHVLKMAPLLLKQLKESVVKEAIDFAGWVAIDHKGKRLEIKKSEAKDLYNAKLLAIKKLKVPKSKESMLAIKPAYNESIELHKKKFNEELSKELAFEVITFMERPIMESSIPNEFDTKDVIDMLVNEGIENVLTKDVHSEFTELLKKYK